MSTTQIASVKLYHPSGCEVIVNISAEFGMELPEQAVKLFDDIDKYLEAGFTTEPPSLEDGEFVEEVGHVVRREIENKDKSVTPVVDLYPMNGKYRIIGHYLNSKDDITDFEAATGFILNTLPLHIGSSIERGKNSQLDKFVVPLQSPINIVMKLNPRWEGDDDKKNTKRLFVRWDGVRPNNLVKMSLVEAHEVLSPGGAKIGSLTSQQLQKLSNSRASNVTDTMRIAALTMLSSSEGV